MAPHECSEGCYNEFRWFQARQLTNLAMACPLCVAFRGALCASLWRCICSSHQHVSAAVVLVSLLSPVYHCCKAPARCNGCPTRAASPPSHLFRANLNPAGRPSPQTLPPADAVRGMQDLPDMCLACASMHVHWHVQAYSLDPETPVQHGSWRAISHRCRR